MTRPAPISMAAVLAGNRKLLAFALALGAITALQVLGRLDAAAVDAIGWIYSALVVGNMGEHWTRRRGSALRSLFSAPPAPATPPDPLEGLSADEVAVLAAAVKKRGL